jgi:hypothetical protein
MQIKYCIYSIRRSGRHIVEEFLRNHLDYKFCNCCIDDETVTKECYKTHVHLKHETIKHFDFNRIEKCIFLYRKDLVEQVDAILRLILHEATKTTKLDTTEEHVSCIINENLSYEDVFFTVTNSIKNFNFKNLVILCNNFYKHVKENKNSLHIDFDSLIYTPIPQLRKIAEFLGYTDKNRIEEAIRDYLPSLERYTKKKMSYTRYIELSNIIKKSLQEKVPPITLNGKKTLNHLSWRVSNN